MENRSKIQEWTGKRVDCSGNEYQMDEVSSDVRFINVVEGCYPPDDAAILTSERRPDMLLPVFTWLEYRIEHNAVEVSHTCGHMSVVTDEDIIRCEGDYTRHSLIDEIARTPCPACYRERRELIMDRNEIASHLLNPGELNAL